GKVESTTDEYAIKFDSKFQDAAQLRNIVIKQNPDGGKVYLKDVADVVDAQTDVTTLNHINGLPSIGIQILKQTDANAVEVSELVQHKLEQLTKDYNDIGIKFKIASD